MRNTRSIRTLGGSPWSTMRSATSRGPREGVGEAAFSHRQVRNHVVVDPAVGSVLRKRFVNSRSEVAERLCRLGIQPHDVLTEPTGARGNAVEGSHRLNGSRKRSHRLVIDLVRCDERKTTVTCAGTPHDAAASSCRRSSSTNGSAAATGTTTAVSVGGGASGVRRSLDRRPLREFDRRAWRYRPGQRLAHQPTVPRPVPVAHSIRWRIRRPQGTPASRCRA